MTIDVSPRSRILSILLLVSLVSCPIFANLIVTAQAPQSFIENQVNPLTTVTFSVFNNSNTDLILDYAMEVINWPGELDDQVWNNGSLSASTFILAGGTGLYTFSVYNPFGDPTDCCDPGLNPISFYIEMSPMAVQPSVRTLVSNSGYGLFFFPNGGSSTAEGPSAATLADLNACLAPATPGPFPNPCPAAANEFLFGGNNPAAEGVVKGTPNPSVTSVTVLDTPEPAGLGLLGIGCAFLGMMGTRRPRSRRG